MVLSRLLPVPSTLLPSIPVCSLQWLSRRMLWWDAATVTNHLWSLRFGSQLGSLIFFFEHSTQLRAGIWWLFLRCKALSVEPTENVKIIVKTLEKNIHFDSEYFIRENQTILLGSDCFKFSIVFNNLKWKVISAEIMTLPLKPSKKDSQWYEAFVFT